jgi:cell division protein ZapB
MLSTGVDINTLEKRIDELITLCDELDSKRRAIETDRENWTQERTSLLEKNEMAKAKIEAMIMRLKSLEQD